MVCRPKQQYLFKTGVPRGVRAIDLELKEKSVVVTGAIEALASQLRRPSPMKAPMSRPLAGTRKRLSRHAPISRVAGSRRRRLPQISLPRMDAPP